MEKRGNGLHQLGQPVAPSTMGSTLRKLQGSKIAYFTKNIQAFGAYESSSIPLSYEVLWPHMLKEVIE